MVKTNQIKKLVNGEIADADDVNQIVENAGNEGGSIPYDGTSHERDTAGNESLGSTQYPYGTLSINQDAYLNEIDTNSPSVASSVQIQNLRKFNYLKDCPSAYTGYGGSILRVKTDETGVEFTSSLGSEVFDTPGADTFQVPAGVSVLYISMCGGGGGGGGGGNGSQGGDGGGGGASIIRAGVKVTAGNTYNLTVGAGGTAPAARGKGGTGGTSSFVGATLTIQAIGGNGGTWGDDPADSQGGAVATANADGADAQSSGNGGGGIAYMGVDGGDGGESTGANGGGGGGSLFGKGGNAGEAAVEYGGGGGGSVSTGETVGYAGKSGVILIEWF